MRFSPVVLAAAVAGCMPADNTAHEKLDRLSARLDALEQKLTDDDIPWFLKDGGRVPNLSGLVKVKEAVKIDQYWAPTRPARSRGISAQSCG